MEIFPVRCEHIRFDVQRRDFTEKLPWFPRKFMGVPLLVKNPQRVHVQPLHDKTGQRMPSWNGRLLSWSGRERNYYQDGATLPIHLSSNCFSYAEVVNYFNELMTFHGVFYEKEMNLECEEGALFGEVRSHGIKELGVLGIKDI
jgi:hypothetical protein